MIEIPNKETQEQPYVPVPSNLGEFMASTGANKSGEEIAPPPAEIVPTDENPDNRGAGDELIFEDPEDEEAKGRAKASRFGGKVIARAVDRGFGLTFGAIAHGDARDYRADEEEFAELQQLFIDFMTEENMALSPVYGLILGILGIYVFKLPDVLKDRKRNIALEAKKSAEDEEKTLLGINDKK